MTVIALFKKNEARRFIITSFIDGTISMYEEGTEKIKEISRKSFTKGYKLVEGTLEDVQSEAPAAPEAPRTVSPEPGVTGGYVGSIDIIQPQGRMHRVVTVTLADPKLEDDISSIDEEAFIIELVNQYGIVHGDRVTLDSGVLGWVDLNGDKPSFEGINPPLLKEEQAAGDKETVTINYVKSGKQVTMTRKEFYKSTTAVSLRDPALPEDPLPAIMENPDADRPAAPPLKWVAPPVALDQVPPPPIAPETQPTPPVKWDLVPAAPEPMTLSEESDQKLNSMRASRDAKTADVKPFVPTPFFLRQSMISAYQQCPDKMYDSYENGYNEESIFTRVGTSIHGVMEDFYEDRENADVPALFDKWWASHAIPDWDWYRDWKGFVERYFEKEAKYEKPQVIATELEFQTTVNGVPVSGTIDRIDRVDEHTIRLVDYKTNFRAFTEVELQESIQFMMYNNVMLTDELRQMLRDRGDTGEYTVVINTYEMLRLGYRQTMIFEPGELELFRGWMKTIWTMILSGFNRKPKLNQYCGYCQKRHKCDLYLEMLKAPVSPIVTENTDVESIVGEREELKKAEKLVKNRLAEIDAQIKMKIAENKGKMEVGGYEWGTQAGTVNSYPAQDVFRVLAMNGLGAMIPDLVSISNTKLQSMLKEHKDVLEKVEAVKVTGYKTPSINKKKIKPVKPTKK
jgi:putative RecB family exonuclease